MHAVLAAGIGRGELLVILVVMLVLFGSSYIPQFAKGLGQAIEEFQKASDQVSEEIRNALDADSLRVLGSILLGIILIVFIMGCISN
jgi:TatA/E family protein of Tat protein translocase